MGKREVPEMKEVIMPIPTKVVTIVTELCPIEVSPREDFEVEHCQECPYVIQVNGKPTSHGWQEYRTSDVREESEREDEEDSTTDYYKTIPCAGCGTDVTFYSGYSNLVHGDNEKCPKCGLLHTFLRFEREQQGKETVYVHIFAIPIKETAQNKKSK